MIKVNQDITDGLPEILAFLDRVEKTKANEYRYDSNNRFLSLDTRNIADGTWYELSLGYVDFQTQKKVVTTLLTCHRLKNESQDFLVEKCKIYGQDTDYQDVIDVLANFISIKKDIL